ncbi:MAG: DUF3047 domain-containing protein [Burkholderiales bacterium]
MHLSRTERLAVLAVLLAAGTAFAVGDRISAGAFSAVPPGNALPAGWTIKDSPNIKVHTRYSLVDDNGSTVLRADSAAGAAGIGRELKVNPAEFPLLRWRWKVANLIEQADLRTKEGDDFPARIYVTFDYPLEKLPFFERSKLRLARTFFDPQLPAATLCYVWDGKVPAETIAPSAYTDRVRLIVAESGPARVGEWVAMERNIARDFRAAFGEAAPPVNGIIIATDSDNTGAKATAFYGDIFFYKQ